MERDVNQLPSTTNFFDSIQGPGHIKTTPVSLRDSSRADLAKMVVAAAVAYMTFKIKYEAFTTQFLPALSPKNGTSTDVALDSAMLKLSNGITLQDVEFGDEIIQIGDSISVETTLYYNGMPVETTVNNNLAIATPLVYGSDELINQLFGTFKFGNDHSRKSTGGKYALQHTFTALGYETLNGMRRGGKRKLLIPPELAFGDEGLLPYVPPNAYVVLDIQIK